MPPSLNFSEWWLKEAREGTPVVVTMENPHYSLFADDGHGISIHGKGPRQKCQTIHMGFAHQSSPCCGLFLAWLASGLWALLGAIKKRVARNPTAASLELEKPGKGKLLYKFLRGFLLLSLVALAFETVAYWNGWHFQKPSLNIPETSEIQGWMHSAYLAWLAFRSHISLLVLI